MENKKEAVETPKSATLTGAEEADTLARNTNIRARCWCATLNNYTKEEYEDILLKLNETEISIVGKEKGESGTPHLQMCMKYKNARTFASMKKLNERMHIEVCKNWPASMLYCKKENDYVEINKQIETCEMSKQYDDYIKKTYKNVVWKDWQKNILDKITTDPHNREITWIYDKEGNKGKSYLIKYIEYNYSCIIIGGKQTDIFNGIKTYLEEKKEYPKVILCDIPRTSESYVSYGSIEKIKDGLFYSGKYEGGVIRLIPTHLFVFANFEPDKSSMSTDRWNIINISNVSIPEATETVTVT